MMEICQRREKAKLKPGPLKIGGTLPRTRGCASMPKG